MRRFLYCEATEGGMEHFTFRYDPNMPAGKSAISSLRGWMDPRWADTDNALVDWMEGCEVGDFYRHRLGVIVRLRYL